MNVSLTPKLKAFVDAKVSSGDYGNASEVMREALRLLQETERLQREKLELLRAALKTGADDIAAGRVTRVASDKDLDALFAAL